MSDAVCECLQLDHGSLLESTHCGSVWNHDSQCGSWFTVATHCGTVWNFRTGSWFSLRHTVGMWGIFILCHKCHAVRPCGIFTLWSHSYTPCHTVELCWNFHTVDRWFTLRHTVGLCGSWFTLWFIVHTVGLCAMFTLCHTVGLVWNFHTVAHDSHCVTLGMWNFSYCVTLCDRVEFSHCGS